MIQRPRLRSISAVWLGLLVLVGFARLAGCDKGTSPSASRSATRTPKKEEPASNKVATGSPEPKPEPVDGLHQPFKLALRENPPEGERPPDKTMTGKSVGKLYTEVVKLWDTIRFTKEDGTRIQYSATVETDLGVIEIALDADRAPNHVRNFIALSKVGYYDGLVFDRIHQEEIPAENVVRFEEIEAGCPLGTGEQYANSIGYWLKPEINEELKHEEGVVGACHGVEKDTAACKFYITLCKAPALDGHYTIFGKVTSGLNVARKIALQPVILEDNDVNGARRPLKPVVIRKVTIHAR